MKYLLFILFVLFISITLDAQQPETRIEPIFTLKYAPTALLPLNTPMIQFAGENFIKSDIGLQYEVGVLSSLIPPFYNYNSLGNKPYGGRLKTEIRKYQHTYFRDIKIRQFWGAGFSFQQIYKEELGTFCIPQSNCTAFVTIPVLKSDVDFNVFGIFGWQYFFNKHFVIEMNLLGGIIRRELAYLYDVSLDSSRFHNPRKSYHPLISTGIYIGYAF